MNKEDILLALIYFPTDKHNPQMSPIQIMKSLFLFKMEMNLSDDEFYKFVPYLYGPCSFEVYSDLNTLENDGILDTNLSLWGWKYYRLTPKGKNRAEKIIQNLDRDIQNKLQSLKKLVMSKSFIELLRYVYAKYPEYAKNSIINPEVFER